MMRSTRWIGLVPVAAALALGIGSYVESKKIARNSTLNVTAMPGVVIQEATLDGRRIELPYTIQVRSDLYQLSFVFQGKEIRSWVRVPDSTDAWVVADTMTVHVNPANTQIRQQMLFGKHRGSGVEPID